MSPSARCQTVTHRRALSAALQQTVEAWQGGITAAMWPTSWATQGQIHLWNKALVQPVTNWSVCDK